ncbi:MAG: hypothetical protein KZQ71_12810, partial [Candidatus Thiodiazotropha sp. (ex Lucinoma aequizonata)]|nr:hypothetical protein [Candidatus Thiodiazotropha sp. (ex Lucinoma aequizonata)]
TGLQDLLSLLRFQFVRRLRAFSIWSAIGLDPITIGPALIGAQTDLQLLTGFLCGCTAIYRR